MKILGYSERGFMNSLIYGIQQDERSVELSR